jgi:hypothetical protein
MPAVVGGGLGDIAEVLDAGRGLARAGFRTILFRLPGRPLPPSVDGPWDLGGVERVSAIGPRATNAITVTPNWGVSAAPDRPGPLGRGGVWAKEAEEVERRYGPERTLHVSLEEFARTLTSTEENVERWREGGATARAIAARRKTRAFREDVDLFHREYRRFRGFDRSNVLHLFQTFHPTPRFAREFPEAVQVGPVWPPPPDGPRPAVRPGEWVWYASPGSSERIVGAIDRGLRGTRVRRVLVRSPRPLALPVDSPVAWRSAGPMGAGEWRAAFVAAGLRVVTGSRTLLEAVQLGRPFLYFNGVLGDGPRRRRHRPEKVRALVRGWRARGVSRTIVRDIDDFSRGRRVAEVVRAAASEPGWSRAFPRTAPSGEFPPGLGDGVAYLVAVATELARGTTTAPDLVRRLRAPGRVRRRREV